MGVQVDDNLLIHLSQYELLKSLPARDPWTRLSVYESGDLARTLLYERHRRRPTQSKAKEVAAHVTHGRLYFEAAEQASTLIRPLLLYYGVLALSRAVVLFADANRREATLSEGHGLACPGWSSTLDKDLGRLADLELKVTSGTLTELSKATRNVERSLVYGSHRLRWPVEEEGAIRLEEEHPQIRVALKAVLGRLPDLLSLFQVTLDGDGACHPAYVQVHPGIQTDFYLIPTRRGLPDIEHVRRSFRLHPDVDIQIHENYYPLGEVAGLEFHLNVETSPPEMRKYLPPIKNDSRGFPYVVEPLPAEVSLSSLSLLFMVSYALGMLVRYHPSHWSALIGHSKGDAILPLLNAAVALVERRFPELILQELEQTHPGATLFRHPSEM